MPILLFEVINILYVWYSCHLLFTVIELAPESMFWVVNLESYFITNCIFGKLFLQIYQFGFDAIYKNVYCHETIIKERVFYSLFSKELLSRRRIEREYLNGGMEHLWCNWKSEFSFTSTDKSFKWSHLTSLTLSFLSHKMESNSVSVSPNVSKVYDYTKLLKRKMEMYLNDARPKLTFISLLTL